MTTKTFLEKKYLLIIAFIVYSVGYSQKNVSSFYSATHVFRKELRYIPCCQKKLRNPTLLATANRTVSNFKKIYIDYDDNLKQSNEDRIISHLRPRLFVRADEAKLGKGLTVSALRSRLKDPAYRDWIDYNPEVVGWESLPAIALQYLLKGEKKNALSVGEYLTNTPFPYKEHTSTAAAVYNSAIAFDWVRDALSDEIANKITAKLVEGAEYLKEGVITPSINHNYTIVSLYGVATVAVSIYGEGKENSQKALEYMKIVKSLLVSDHMLLETFKEKQGTWEEGNHYRRLSIKN